MSSKKIYSLEILDIPHLVFQKKVLKKLNAKEQDTVLSVVARLAEDETLEPRYKDHALVGNFSGCRECHIKPDLLLVYKITEDVLELALIEVGSHAELFG